MIYQLTGIPDKETLMQLRFFVSWTQHGGSGLNISFRETLDLTVGNLLWLFNQVKLQREAESDAIHKASK